MKLVIAPDKFLENTVPDFDYNVYDPYVTSAKMVHLMTTEGGLGLAANQVSLDAKIFVMKPIINKVNAVYDMLTVINPVIVTVSDETFTEVEGCLSYPGIFMDITRPKKVLVEYDTLTQDGNSVIHVGQMYEDIDARIFLHEFDHLHGIQFIDRVSKLKKQMCLKKLSKSKKRN